MRRIVIGANGNVIERSATPATAPEKRVEFVPPKLYVAKQYSPHVNTADTQYKGGCGGCGGTKRH